MDWERMGNLRLGQETGGRIGGQMYGRTDKGNKPVNKTTVVACGWGLGRLRLNAAVGPTDRQTDRRNMM